jgi:UrcA family protein
MNTETYLPRRFSSQIAVRSVALTALLAVAPLAAMAQSEVAASTRTLTSKVSVADLDLSTSAGMDAARDRLHQTARGLCSQVADSQDPYLTQKPTFIACVDDTLTDALRQINGPARAAIEGSTEWHTQPSDSTRSRSPPTAPETHVVAVSLANLDLSTPDGVRMAHVRIKSAARRVCRQLSGSIDPSEKRHYANCVDDATAGALRQVRGPRVAAIEESGKPVGSVP